MEDVADAAVARPRLTAGLLAGFALLALLLAAVGIYGVVSYSVARRTREIGVRMALGARRRTVLGMVVGEGVVPAAVGAALGLGAAFLLAETLRGLLFGVSATDPLTFALVPALLLGVAVAASWIPARRATREDETRAGAPVLLSGTTRRPERPHRGPRARSPRPNSSTRPERPPHHDRMRGDML